jgi:hypothetical protein
MNLPVPLLTAALLLMPVYAQSGRRVKDRLPAPPAAEKPKEASPVASIPDVAPTVTAEKNQDYRCTDDGTLARIIDDEVQSAQFFPPRR